MGPSERRTVTVTRGLCVFADGQGLRGGIRERLDPDVVEAFVVRGLPGRTPSTKGTYRSLLLNEAAEHGWPRKGRGTPFPGARAAVPYSTGERAELFAMARAQRLAHKRSSCLALIGLGIGAGLSHAELVAAQGGDISGKSRGVLVRVRGARPRTVPVVAPFAQIVRELACRAGGDVVFRPGGTDRSYKNFVSDFTDHLTADPSCPRLTLSRCRSSFVCWHLAARTSIARLIEISGLASADSVLRYARHVDGAPRSKVALHELIAHELIVGKR